MSIKTFLNEIRKTTGSTSFLESKIGEISGYINTGSLALNRLISGKLRKGGIPRGRVVVLAGESASGKSLVGANCTRNAQEDHEICFYFDSEGGGLKSFFEARGCDLGRIEHVPLESIEDATPKILTVYQQIREEKKANPNFRAFCIVDSLGALVPNKVYKDAYNGKQVMDMGIAARLKNNLIRAVTMPALLSDSAIVFISHTYKDPSAMYPGKIENQSGGEGAKYMASVSIQCNKRFEKPEEKADSHETYYNGNSLKFFSVKNRIIKPFYETSLFIDFDTGIQTYDGLVDPALAYGLITEGKPGYFIVPKFGEEQIKKETILSREDVWATIIDDLDDMSFKDMSYKSVAEHEKLNKEEVIEEVSEKPIEVISEPIKGKKNK